MKKTIIFLIFFFIFSNKIFACMPYMEHQIFIWKFENEYEKNFPKEYFYQENKIISWKFVNFSDLDKPFDKYNDIWEYFFYKVNKKDFINEKINLENFQKWDKIIMISDYTNWKNEETKKYFSINAIWKIECKNWKIEITNASWYQTSWWKEMWQCWWVNRDYWITKEELLKKLEEKYNFCEKSKENTKKEENLFEKIINFFKNLFAYL